jgi:hypothetical protein
MTGTGEKKILCSVHSSFKYQKEAASGLQYSTLHLCQGTTTPRASQPYPTNHLPENSAKLGFQAGLSCSVH